MAAAALVYLGNRFSSTPRETPVVKVFRSSSPAVVSLSVEPLPERPELGFWAKRWLPWVREYFRQYYGEDGQNRELNLGSGIVVDPRGYILTNEHVVVNAARIQVKLADGRMVYGEVWGTDPSLDVAVVKVTVEGSLPYLKMEGGGDIMVGEPVVVIGNPLGLGHTCTTGIISALHRSVSVGGRSYGDLIQVDAAVNPGNSGGPLLNIGGELIGITTALNPEAEGIGFAIPIERARKVVEDLIIYRYVPTGWLGINVSEPESAGGALTPGSSGGVLVTRVEESGPAAGVLREGDVLETWNGRAIEGVAGLVENARRLRDGDEVELIRHADGKRDGVSVRARAFPEEKALEWAAWHLGLAVEESRYRTLAPDGKVTVRDGVFVQAVAGNSPAGAVGLAPGDLILRINRDEISGLVDFEKAVVRLRDRSYLFLVLKRRGFTLGVTVPIRESGEGW